jgi:hypothetical protein
MESGVTISWTPSDANESSMKIIPPLLLLMTVAAGAIVILAFQRWVDFGITESSGTDADAATGISDGWFVAGLGSAILVLIGGALFRPKLASVLLPMIAVAAVSILAIAGFDTVTNWHASGFHTENPGVLVQAQGDPTIVPYAIAGLAILIALLAAVARGIQLREGQRVLEDLRGAEGGPIVTAEVLPED